MSGNRRSLRSFVMRLSPGGEWLFGIALAVFDAVLLNLLFRGVFKYWLYEVAGRIIYINAYFDVRWYLFAMFVSFGLMFDVFRIRSLTAASDIFSHVAATLLSTFVAFNLLISMYRPMATLAYMFPRPVILFTTVLGIALIFTTRVLLTRWFKPHTLLKRAVIIGDEEEGKRIIRHVHRRGGVRYRLLDTFRPDQVRELASEVVFRHVQEILVTDPHIRLDAFWAEIFYNRKVEPHPFMVRIACDPTTAAGTAGLISLEDLPLISVSSLPLTTAQRLIKRAFDTCFALFALVVASPLMILTAVLMRLDSPGPVFYRQKRVGRYGREYDVIKFRSMRAGAEAGKGPQISTADDPRVTRLGRFIRRVGLDELPQFFLVLTGDMSVVGPRPERPFFVNQHLEFQGRRLSVRPGVTGLAAVNARYYLRLTDKVSYDYYYLDQYSIILDIKIVFQTIWVLLFVSGQAKALEDKHHSMDKMSTPPDSEP
ncbi:MAG TPA: sugar transferase, partial [Candidatus Ozemobacteraceae bacterium]|nr:sugar transferase [Candidatus Ozemobacteraceae bacterium]